jgi:hypothetical protein
MAARHPAELHGAAVSGGGPAGFGTSDIAAEGGAEIARDIPAARENVQGIAARPEPHILAGEAGRAAPRGGQQ